MKQYTFLDLHGAVLAVEYAENHDQAVAQASEEVTYSTDFYSETLPNDDKEAK